MKIATELEAHAGEGELRQLAPEADVDPQDVARRLGDTLTMLHRTRMKKAKREERLAEAMEKASAPLAHT